jgi:hypothetical protein
VILAIDVLIARLQRCKSMMALAWCGATANNDGRGCAATGTPAFAGAQRGAAGAANKTAAAFASVLQRITRA